jgi:general secretion pathway protein I
MGALLQTSAQNASNTSALRDRAIAQWVAANKLAEVQLQKNWPSIGKKTGQSEMASTPWYWQTEVSKVNDKDLRRIVVRVKKTQNAESYLYSLPGFLASPNVISRATKEKPQ